MDNQDANNVLDNLHDELSLMILEYLSNSSPSDPFGDFYLLPPPPPQPQPPQLLLEPPLQLPQPFWQELEPEQPPQLLLQPPQQPQPLWQEPEPEQPPQLLLQPPLQLSQPLWQEPEPEQPPQLVPLWQEPEPEQPPQLLLQQLQLLLQPPQQPQQPLQQEPEPATKRRRDEEDQEASPEDLQLVLATPAPHNNLDNIIHEIRKAAERCRRHKFRRRMEILKRITPNCEEATDAATLERAVEHIKRMKGLLDMMSKHQHPHPHPLPLLLPYPHPHPLPPFGAAHHFPPRFPVLPPRNPPLLLLEEGEPSNRRVTVTDLEDIDEPQEQNKEPEDNDDDNKPPPGNPFS